MALNADILVCTESAKFCFPEVNLGLSMGSGGSVCLARAVGKSKAMEMLLTGEPITA